MVQDRALRLARRRRCPAQALYDALGYRHAHGPFVSSAALDADDGPLHVHAVLDYLVKDL